MNVRKKYRSRPTPPRLKPGTSKAEMQSSEALFLLSMLTPIFAVFGVLGFVSGFSYLAKYYDYFGLTTSDAGVDTNAILVHALTAMQIGWGPMIAVCYAMVGALLTLTRAKGRANRTLSLLSGIAILVVLPLTSWIAADAGFESAKQDCGERSSLPNITIKTSGKDECRVGKLICRKESVYFVAGLHPCDSDAPNLGTAVVTVAQSDTVVIDHYVGVE